MDIHRSRFVPFPPSAINALAFSHTEPEHGQQEPESLRLAIGRANGNIEIWNPANGAWLQEKVFYGGKDRSVEGLVWTQNPDQKDSNGKIIPGRLRLFSIGYSSSVTEWDLATGLPARHSNGNHSDGILDAKSEQRDQNHSLSPSLLNGGNNHVEMENLHNTEPNTFAPMNGDEEEDGSESIVTSIREAPITDMRKPYIPRGSEVKLRNPGT